MAATAAGLTLQDMVSTYIAGYGLSAMLTDGTWAFNKQTSAFRAEVTGEITGTGYVAGGVPLTGVVVQQDTANSRIEIAADEANFGTLTATGIAGLVVYQNTGSAATDRILSVHTFTAESPAGENFTYAWNDDDAAPATKGIIGYITY